MQGNDSAGVETSLGSIPFPGRVAIAKAQQRRTGVEALGQGLAQLFSFVGCLSVSGVSGYKCGRNYHSNERKANQEIVHGSFSFGCIQPVAGFICPHLNHPPDYSFVK
jgi:hypothetical protein